MPANRPMPENRPAARAIAIATAEQDRRRMVGLAFNCVAASLLLTALAVSFAVMF